MKKRATLLFTLLTILLCVGVQAQNIIYVNDDASGANNGTSWTDAFTDFQAGVNAASAGDRVFVAVGIYQPASGASFSMKQGVKIYGGFAGTETSLAQRDLSSGDTSILKGNNASVIRNDNNGLDVTAVLDGFMITGGHANSAGASGSGSGMHNKESSPTIRNVTISGNWGGSNGAGMANYQCSPIITNVTISGNETVYDAGGMYNYESSPTLTNVAITGNIAHRNGGGMLNFTSSPTLTNVTIAGNTADFLPIFCIRKNSGLSKPENGISICCKFIKH